MFPLKRLFPFQHWFWAALSSWLWLKEKPKEAQEGELGWSQARPSLGVFLFPAGCGNIPIFKLKLHLLGTQSELHLWSIPGSVLSAWHSWDMDHVLLELGSSRVLQLLGFFPGKEGLGKSLGNSGSQADLENLGSGSTVGREGVREGSEPSLQSPSEELRAHPGESPQGRLVLPAVQQGMGTGCTRSTRRAGAHSKAPKCLLAQILDSLEAFSITPGWASSAGCKLAHR